MAPELLKNDDGGYTKSIDIWALGCIWYSLVNNNEDLFTGISILIYAGKSLPEI